VLNTGHRRGGKASCCVGQGANITFREKKRFALHHAELIFDAHLRERVRREAHKNLTDKSLINIIILFAENTSTPTLIFQFFPRSFQRSFAVPPVATHCE
jgi:hypothetical protein